MDYHDKYNIYKSRNSAAAAEASNDFEYTDNKINQDFKRPLIKLNSSSTNNNNASSIDFGDNLNANKNFNDRFNKYRNCLPDFNIKKKNLNYKNIVYNFLERPTGWLVCLFN